ncbi:unnamed protein product, partial [Anisakis simplex]|uniref:Uncharacterized protein n=1 Tax=Anisakis simplex TaxID=6269 RepID=A0A0M3JQ58_ANISI
MAWKRAKEMEGETFGAGKGGREGETPATEEPGSEGLRHGAGKPEDEGASSGMAWKRAKEMEGEMSGAGKGGREGETPATEEPGSDGLRHGAGRPEDEVPSSGISWKRAKEIEGEMFGAGKGGREDETPATEEPGSEGLRHGAGKPEDE